MAKVKRTNSGPQMLPVNRAIVTSGLGFSGLEFDFRSAGPTIPYSFPKAVKLRRSAGLSGVLMVVELASGLSDQSHVSIPTVLTISPIELSNNARASTKAFTYLGERPCQP